MDHSSDSSQKLCEHEKSKSLSVTQCPTCETKAIAAYFRVLSETAHEKSLAQFLQMNE